ILSLFLSFPSLSPPFPPASFLILCSLRSLLFQSFAFPLAKFSADSFLNPPKSCQIRVHPRPILSSVSSAQQLEVHVECDALANPATSRGTLHRSPCRASASYDKDSSGALQAILPLR